MPADPDPPTDSIWNLTRTGDAALVEQEPLERVTVADQVVQRIVSLLKAGNLRAGDRLPTENELATAFHISRPSVREGLKMLRMLGVAESRQGGRHYITDLSPARLIKPLQFVVMLQEYDANAHIEARMAVDLALTRLACERATKVEIEKIQFLAKAGYQFMSDPVGFRLLDVEFHQTINESARSPMLMRLSQSLYELVMEYRRIATETHGVIAQSLADHDLIARAISQRKPELAQRAFRLHLDHVRATTIEAQRTFESRPRATTQQREEGPTLSASARKKSLKGGR